VSTESRPASLTDYLTSGDFVEAAFENWDSEFLQMGMYVVLTAYLFQKGSSESKPIATRRQPAAERGHTTNVLRAFVILLPTVCGPPHGTDDSTL
jgi:hypothetical protein